MLKHTSPGISQAPLDSNNLIKSDVEQLLYILQFAIEGVWQD